MTDPIMPRPAEKNSGDSTMSPLHPADRPAHGGRSMRENVIRRIRQAILALGAIAVIICGSMVVTSAFDDARIASDKAVATAEVTSVNTLRTYVRFRDERGNYHQPSVGLKYPTGLTVGQRVAVEYEGDNPENVKVQGRGWTLAIIPTLSSIAVVLVIAGALWLLVRQLERKLMRPSERSRAAE